VLVKIRDTPGNRSSSKTNQMRFRDTPGNRVKYLEVLAGAISWGFKSPSPHHRISSLERTLAFAGLAMCLFCAKYGERGHLINGRWDEKRTSFV